MNPLSIPDDMAPELPLEGPGNRLRAAREARRLDVARVATELHLSSATIIALETDAEDKLPGPVFVRGYLRNYARLLGLNEAPILEAYRPSSVQKPPRQAVSSMKIRKEIRSSHLVVRLVTWLILVGLIVSVGIWFKEEISWTSLQREVKDATGQSQAELDSAPPDLQFTQPAAEDLSLPQLEQPLTTFEPISPNEPVTAPPPDMLPAAESESLSETPDVETPPLPRPITSTRPETPADATAPKGQTALRATPGIESSALPAVVDTSTGVVLQFTDSCWVEVRDRFGDIVLIGNMRPGSSRHLTGQHPFKITLGNSQMVNLTIDGEPFDITPFSRGNVARFELDPVTRQGSQ